MRVNRSAVGRTIKDDLIKKYLLGVLSADERSRLEDDYFADGDLFEDVVSAENDLIDAYVRGALSDAERQQFEHRYKNSSSHAARIGFAKALAQVLESENQAVREGRRGFWGSFSPFFHLRHPQLTWALAVITVLTAGVSLLSLRNYRLRRDLANARAGVTQPGPRQNDAPSAHTIAPQAQEQRLPEIQVGDQVARLDPSAVLPFRLFPGAVRGGEGGGKKELVVPKNCAWIRLEMVLDQDEFSAYEAVLQTAEGEEVLRTKALKSISMRGKRVLVWSLRSDRIPSGDYAVRLRGEKHDGGVEDAEFYILRVAHQ
jgi:hypothetical protein